MNRLPNRLLYRIGHSRLILKLTLTLITHAKTNPTDRNLNPTTDPNCIPADSNRNPTNANPSPI